MRKYVLTDANGLTPSGQQVKPGKFIEQSSSGKDILERLGDCCAETPLAAVLLSPFSSRAGHRLFQINCWKVGTDPREAQSYTVVKEDGPVPAVSLEQKIRFALLALTAVYKQKDFTDWARRWLTGEDRGLPAAQRQREMIEREVKAAEALETLAAWGEAGGSDARLTARMEQLTQAARHVALAAELAAKNSPPDVEQVGKALAQAFALLCRSGQPIDFAALAEEAIGGGAPPASEQAAGP